MVNQLLLNLVNSVLGRGKPTARNNYAYSCPFCLDQRPKFEVNLTENSKGENPWHCWVCDAKGKNLFHLFKSLDISYEKVEELKSIINSSDNYQIPSNKEEKVQLPEGFTPLWKYNQDKIEFKHALNYLYNRGLTKLDIIKYNIGLCAKAPYHNMLVIPLYNSRGELVYFSTRNYTEFGKKTINPPISRDIIANEHLINWDLPIILCEGVFDSISIKRNAIPLLGKNLQNELMKKIVTSQIKKIYIALDKDAIKNSLKFCELLLNEGKEVYLVEMESKDPNELGFENFTHLLHSVKPINYSILMEKKLELI